MVAVAWPLNFYPIYSDTPYVPTIHTAYAHLVPSRYAVRSGL
jgi:hypothetical protein